MIFMTRLFRFEDLFHGLCSSLSVWICTLIRSCDDIYTSTVYTQGCQPHCKETLPRRTKEPYPYSIMSLISQSKLLTLADPWWPLVALEALLLQRILDSSGRVDAWKLLGLHVPSDRRTCAPHMVNLFGHRGNDQHISTYFNMYQPILGLSQSTSSASVSLLQTWFAAMEFASSLDTGVLYFAANLHVSGNA